MKTVRRFASCLLALAMAMLMLTACGDSGSSTSYKLYQLSDRTQNGYSAQTNLYLEDDFTSADFGKPDSTSYLTTDGSKEYLDTTVWGMQTVTLKDNAYEYTLDEAAKTYTKKARSSSQSGNADYAFLPAKSDFGVITVGKTTVHGVEYYSETISKTQSGFTVKCHYCFGSDGSLKYAVVDMGSWLGAITVEYTSFTCTADTSKLTLDGYTEATAE